MAAVEGSNNDVLLFNSTGGPNGGPAGVLVPASSIETLGGTLGEGEQAWATAIQLVQQGQATQIPVRELETLSANLTEITLLMPPDELMASATTAVRKRGGATKRGGTAKRGGAATKRGGGGRGKAKGRGRAKRK